MLRDTTGHGTSAYTHVPFDLAEELAVVVIALSEVISCNQDVPPVLLLRRNCVVEHVTQPGTIVLVGVVRLDIDLVPSELLKLATPILQR